MELIKSLAYEHRQQRIDRLTKCDLIQFLELKLKVFKKQGMLVEAFKIIQYLDEIKNNTNSP